MQWHDYLITAMRDLTREGTEFEARDVHDRALTLDGAEEAYELVGNDLARAKSIREASRLLREADAEPFDDPEQAPLFDDIQYRPPRAITMRTGDGRTVHKGVEHATLGDLRRFDEVLKDNIKAANEKRRGFVTFLAEVTPYFASESSRLVDALLDRKNRKRNVA